MSADDNFYIKRRSVLARKMSSEPINDADLKTILDAGIRVPDHGALNPWKIIVINKEKQKIIDEQIIFSEYRKANPDANEHNLQIEANRLQRASVVVAVLSTPVEHSKIPNWEMVLSSGAVCMNLLSCAQSLGYAAQWLTEWYAYNGSMIKELGGNPNTDKIAGFIYIGDKDKMPVERRRPSKEKVIRYITS